MTSAVDMIFLHFQWWTSCGQVIAAGKSKLASVPTGGAVMAGAAAASSSAGGGGGSEEKGEEKEEEKKEEEEEESDDDMGFGLFD